MLMPDLEMGYTPQEEAIPALSAPPGHLTGQHQPHPASSSGAMFSCHLHICRCMLFCHVAIDMLFGVPLLAEPLSLPQQALKGTLACCVGTELVIAANEHGSLCEGLTFHQLIALLLCVLVSFAVSVSPMVNFCRQLHLMLTTSLCT